MSRTIVINETNEERVTISRAEAATIVNALKHSESCPLDDDPQKLYRYATIESNSGVCNVW